jgi:Protein of unknown function (DUF3667)
MSEVGAIGEVMSGAVLSRALEPDTGTVASDGHTHERACLNCATPLVGDYCHACGQRGHVHRTLGAFFHDLLHGVFHFEGKIWRTLPMLAWQPGRLTRDYIDGKRASFVSPIALFLFCVFLMFGVLGATANLDPKFDANGKKDLATAQREAEARLETIERDRQDAVTTHRSPAGFDKQIKDKQTEIDVIKALRGRGVDDGPASSLPKLTSKSSWLENGYANAYREAKRNPQLLIYKLKSNAYKWSWALIPLSAPFVWLLFPFSRRFRLYDHIVFITYSLCFMSLLVMIGSTLAYVGAPPIAAMLMLVPPVHLYRQLRGTYTLSRTGALWRTVLLLFFAMIVLITYALLIVTLGLD